MDYDLIKSIIETSFQTAGWVYLACIVLIAGYLLRREYLTNHNDSKSL